MTIIIYYYNYIYFAEGEVLCVLRRVSVCGAVTVFEIYIQSSYTLTAAKCEGTGKKVVVYTFI